MRRIAGLLIAFLISLSIGMEPAHSTEMSFDPDTVNADLGDTITISAYITSSITVRSFTVYLTYDTNDVDLVNAPVPGALITSLPGLDFRYSDHIPAAPDWLEVGATIFGNTFWAGPGELFQLSLVVRECGALPMSGSFSLREPDGTFHPGDFSPPALFMCDAPPTEPDSLTIFWTGTAADLRWRPVTLNTFGQTLAQPPMYYIYRADDVSPFVIIDSTMATVYTDLTVPADNQFYYVTAVSQ